MRYRSSSRLSYRNVLIAAGLAAALGVGTAHSKPGAGIAAQRHADRQTPDRTVAPAPADSAQRAARVPGLAD
jgi:hypothetical protein